MYILLRQRVLASEQHLRSIEAASLLYYIHTCIYYSDNVYYDGYLCALWRVHPLVSSPIVLSPSVSSPSVLSPSLLSPSVSSPSVLSPSVSSLLVSALSQCLLSPSVCCPTTLGRVHPRVSSPSVSSHSVLSPFWCVPTSGKLGLLPLLFPPPPSISFLAT